LGFLLTGAAEEPASLTTQLSAIQKAHRELTAKIHAPVGEKSRLPTPREMEVRFAKFDPLQTELFHKSLEIAQQAPASESAFTAIEWMLRHPRAWYVEPGLPALVLLLKHHGTNMNIGPLVATIGYFLPIEEYPFHAPAVDLLRAVARHNPDRTARGNAMLGLARLEKRGFSRVESKGGSEAARLAAKTIAAFEQVVRDYGDCPDLRTLGLRPSGATLAEEAQSELRELRQIRLGVLAPEIAGRDLPGRPLKLSDHRGKVVLLVFWASWCGPCLAEVPHERALVEKFKDRPFVLLGVNGDQSVKSARETAAEYRMSWRSFRGDEKRPEQSDRRRLEHSCVAGRLHHRSSGGSPAQATRHQGPRIVAGKTHSLR
jgi:thiol-disulfide isomerase/thioredoxin